MKWQLTSPSSLSLNSIEINQKKALVSIKRHTYTFDRVWSTRNLLGESIFWFLEFEYYVKHVASIRNNATFGESYIQKIEYLSLRPQTTYLLFIKNWAFKSPFYSEQRDLQRVHHQIIKRKKKKEKRDTHIPKTDACCIVCVL
jgi:hypothetical protein